MPPEQNELESQLPAETQSDISSVDTQTETAPVVAETPKERSLEDMLIFDPFEDKSGSEKTTKAGTDQPAKVAEQPSTPAASVEGEDKNLKQTPQAPAADINLAEELRKLNEQLAQTAVEKAPAKVEEAKTPKYEMPNFNYNIPPKLLQLIDSDEPAEKAQGIQLMLQGVSETVYKMAMENSLKILEERFASVPDLVQKHTREVEEQKQVFTDFYGKYPQLNRPELRPLISQVAAQMTAANPNIKWNAELRDSIGKQVLSILSGVQPTPKQPAVRAPVQTVSNARPAAPKPTELEEELKSLLF